MASNRYAGPDSNNIYFRDAASIGVVDQQYTILKNWVVSFNAVGSDLTFVSAIPEPSTYAALFGACALGCAAWRRRRGLR